MHHQHSDKSSKHQSAVEGANDPQDRAVLHDTVEHAHLHNHADDGQNTCKKSGCAETTNPNDASVNISNTEHAVAETTQNSDDTCCDSCRKNANKSSHAHSHKKKPHTDHTHGACTDGCCTQDGHGDHGHDDGCDCGKERPKNQLKKDLCVIGASLLLLLLGIFLPIPGYYSLFFYIPSYLIAGGTFLLKAFRNILKGKVFDENFLMAIATLGAFAIGEFAEAVAVMLLYYIGEMLQSMAVSKSRKSVTELLGLQSKIAHKLTDAGLVDIDPSKLKIGDRILVNAGEKIPADGIIEDGTGWLDYSALNGESVPVEAGKGDEILGGAINQSSVLTLRIHRDYKDTTVSKIIELVEESQNKKPASEKFITKFAKYYTPAVVAIALIIAFVVPAFSGYAGLSAYIKQALVFLVISCPCALVISIPLAFFAGIGGASKKGILIKGGNYLETLNTIDTVVFDKTGTLTEGVFEVQNVYTGPGITREELLELAVYAEMNSNHPIANSIRKYYPMEADPDQIAEYTEIAGFGTSLKLAGSLILCGKRDLLLNNGIDCAEESRAGTMIYLAKDGQYLGAIEIADKLRPEAKAVIATLKARGKKIIMMTGDTEKPARHIASELGIDTVYYGLLPQDKAEKMRALTESGAKVAFVGDGLNDAPVLTLATLGICISGLNNDASIEASDLVLIGGSLKALPDAFRAASKTRKISVENIVLALLTKLIIMILSFILVPSMWLAIIADVGVSLLAVANSTRALKIK